MQMKKKNIYYLTFGVFLIDQVIKYFIVHNIQLSEVVNIIPNFFYLTYVKNTGGAWSLFNSIPYLLIIVSFLFLIFVNRYILKKQEFSIFEVIYLGFIMGGVLGNLIDRVMVSGVIDYIGLKFGSYYYPIFNFADIFIVAGMLLIILKEFGGEKYEHSRSRRK